MSTECRDLATYVRELIARLKADAPRSHARLRAVVGSRRAAIALDAERVEVAFRGDRLRVSEPPLDRAGEAPDGEGATDRKTTLELLDGDLEVTDALLAGRLRIAGEPDDVTRIAQAIEILLDAAARSASLRALAEDFRTDPCREPADHSTSTQFEAPPWPPAIASEAELALLSSLDLLPDRHRP